MTKERASANGSVLPQSGRSNLLMALRDLECEIGNLNNLVDALDMTDDVVWLEPDDAAGEKERNALRAVITAVKRCVPSLDELFDDVWTALHNQKPSEAAAAARAASDDQASASTLDAALRLSKMSDALHAVARDGGDLAVSMAEDVADRALALYRALDSAPLQRAEA